ncbi:MAG TPA: ATP-binding cassette domain-containing protein [Saprospiraceae bacterium]|nr:ATP-binding cassette domain-containing protein [Saprospiraceae bacterium]MCC6689830.1 ATP-binding cassette domain-containing protein [Saprospiraceae bacterium]HMX85059.1 ATP-binding cassette domain-containing protein [Saprospiraceae bacterium]HMZ73015.1 ATP-binding cassette domain-containing protein [Saprospiraceae bacterium]HNE65329.1 ATP-binding cassette domain-containing protein [Saprospiraceae bacterium]
MLTVSNLGLQYGKRVLFDEVNLTFTGGNCYGVIGANGAGKTTFLKILSGQIDATRGSVSIEPGYRMAVLKQNHFEFDEYDVLSTVMMGYRELYDIMNEKNAIYMDPDATEEDGMRAAELETKYGEMGGWTAESDAAELLSNMGITEDLHYQLMHQLNGTQKVKVLLAQALFGNPDILLLDEPTNDLDPETIMWLEDFLADYRNLVIVVSHDRHFLDMVCTHVVDIDFGKIKIFSGNYSFWYESSQLALKQMLDKNAKLDKKRQEMMEFIQRFSANASKSKQATSRKKALDKLNLEEIQPSSRKYPFIFFKSEREAGNEIFKCNNLGKKNLNGEWLFRNVNVQFNKGDKIGLVSKDSVATTAFYNVIAGIDQPDEGNYEYGQTITKDYLPVENADYFAVEHDLDLINWLRQYSKEKDEQFIRGFLGKMLFSGEEVYKMVSVLSGGEKVRCMLSKIMLSGPNFLLVDEPTNHLDLESITAFNNALTAFPGSLFITSHDHRFMQTVANRVVEISPNGMMDKLMDYDEFLASDAVKEQRRQLYGESVVV